jgi:hypothetical protein
MKTFLAVFGSLLARTTEPLSNWFSTELFPLQFLATSRNSALK